tara:strand:- start:37 stop:441 length:405 start_codon:yes stop_codon:yes gene_type:complete
MITDVTKRKVALFLKDMYTKANVGNGGNATAPNATDLDVPILSTKQTTSNSESNDTTIDFSASFSGSSLQGNSIREVGFFSSTMPQDAQFDELRTTTTYTAETSDVMLARINFDAIGPITSADTLDFTFTMEVE